MKKKILLLALLHFAFFLQAQTPIQEFNFNGNRSNTENSNSFLGISKFVTDRAGVANSALRLTNAAMEVTLPNLPLANSSRTISIWVKYNDVKIANYIWGYGSTNNAQYFGLLQQKTTTAKSDLNLAGFGPTNDVIVTTEIAQNTWYNYVVTYDGLASKIYRNGELIKSSISPRKLTSGTVFSIGKMGTAVSIDADIDDLKIYNVALSETEVLSIYNNNSFLAPNTVATAAAVIKSTDKKGIVKSAKTSVSSTKNQEVGLSTKSAEIIEVKSSEVYSTKGLKVYSASGNLVDITTLPEGTYLLKVKSSTPETSNKQMVTVK